MDAASDRLQLVEIGRTSEDRSWYLALISSAENLVNVEWFAEPESGPITRGSGLLYQFQLSFKFDTAKLLELQGVEPGETTDSESDDL